METEMITFCAEKARKGDGAFAVAYALLELADSQAATCRAIQRLGTGDAATSFGAIEALGIQVEKAAKVIADAVTYIGDVNFNLDRGS